MSSPARPLADCRVVGGEKLPASSGGAEALCAAITEAAAAEAPNSRFSVEVRVLGSSMLSAIVTTADGRKLPEQRFASSDRDLTRTSFERFAQALAGEAAKAGAR